MVDNRKKVTGDYDVVFNSGVGASDTMSFYDLRVIYNQYKDLNIAYYRDLRKFYCMYPGDRSKYIKKRQKNIKSGMSMFFSESVFSALLDSDVRYVVGGRGIEDGKTADAVLDWIEYLHTRSDQDTSFRDAIKETVIFGTGFFKVGYNYKESEFKYMGKDGKTKTGTDVDDYSTMKFVSAMSLIVDGTARNEDEARYFIERKIIAKDNVEDYYSFYNIKLTDEVISAANYVDNIDYERWRKDLFMASSYFSDKPIRDEVYYYLKEKTVECFEVYQRGKTSIFINGYKYGPFEQIGPRKKCPYRAMQFIRVPNSVYGMGVGMIVKPVQEVFDSILNSRMDNVALVNNKVFLHVTSLDPVLTNTDFLELEPGKILHMAQENALQEFPMADVKQGPILESDNLMKLTEQSLGTNAYMTGAQGKVERSAFAVEAIQKSALNRIKRCIKSISKAMGFAAKYELILSLEYTDKKTFEKVLGPEKSALLQAIDIKDAINDIDLEYSLDAMKIQSIATKMQQAIQLLQLVPGLTNPQTGQSPVNVKQVLKYILQGLGLTEDVEVEEEPQVPGQPMPGQPQPGPQVGGAPAMPGTTQPNMELQKIMSQIAPQKTQ